MTTILVLTTRNFRVFLRNQISCIRINWKIAKYRFFFLDSVLGNRNKDQNTNRPVPPRQFAD